MRAPLADHWFALGLVPTAGVTAGLVWIAPGGARWTLIDWALLALVLAAALGAAVGLAQAWRRRWPRALSTAGAIVVIIVAGFVVLFTGAMDSLFFSEDHFADGLTIPEDLAVREPGDRRTIADVADPRGALLVAIAAERAQVPSRTVHLAMPSLDAIDASRVESLRAYLAASPHWHVGEERGRAFAYRRFVSDDQGGTHDSLNGYYSSSSNGRREWRVVLGFGGTVFADRFTGEGAYRTSARTGSIELAGGASGDSFADPTTYLTLERRPVVVEIYERGIDDDRSVTRAALALVDDTVASFLRGEPLAPPARGEPALELSPGMQPGIYVLTAMVNPGARGHVYVRAFEVTRSVELSATRLRDRTLQAIGSSHDPAELFRYDTQLTLYEGNWGQHYAARFELWFVPADGSDERRLLSDVFRVEGWMR